MDDVRPHYDTIAIVGVGLIGGSIGMAMLQRELAKRVVGIGRRASSLDEALSKHAISDATTDIERGVAEAELIIVCTPVDQIVGHVCAAAASCPDSALITDAGSVKSAIVEGIEARMKGRARFVGSHPIAGSHRKGPLAASADLFCDRLVVITPTERTDPSALTEVRRMWKALGAQLEEMPPPDHDVVLAATSHVPHLAAAALAAATDDEHLRFAGTGWGDSTRIAAADPNLWLPILRQNRERIVESFDSFAEVLDSIRNALKDSDFDRIAQIMHAGKRNRDTLGN